MFAQIHQHFLVHFDCIKNKMFDYSWGILKRGMFWRWPPFKGCLLIFGEPFSIPEISWSICLSCFHFRCILLKSTDSASLIKFLVAHHFLINLNNFIDQFPYWWHTAVAWVVFALGVESGHPHCSLGIPHLKNREWEACCKSHGIGDAWLFVVLMWSVNCVLRRQLARLVPHTIDHHTQFSLKVNTGCGDLCHKEQRSSNNESSFPRPNQDNSSKSD